MDSYRVQNSPTESYRGYSPNRSGSIEDTIGKYPTDPNRGHYEAHEGIDSSGIFKGMTPIPLDAL